MRFDTSDRRLPAGQTVPGHRSHAPLAMSDDRRAGGRERSKETPPDHRQADGSGGVSRLFRALPLTLALTALSALALMTLGAAVACRAPDPAALVAPVAYGSMGLASLLGGIIAGRRNGEACFTGGLLAGGMVVLLLLLLSFLVKPIGAGSPLLVWISRFSVVLLHMLGAYLARPRQKAAAHTAGGHSAPHRHRR